VSDCLFPAPDFRYTEKTLDLARRVDNTLDAIMRDAVRAGMNPREVGMVMTESVVTTVADAVLCIGSRGRMRDEYLGLKDSSTPS
jgi:hypothetical protein